MQNLTIQIRTKQGLIVGQKMSKIRKKRGSILPSPVPPSNKGTPHWPKIMERSAERGMFGRSLLQWHTIVGVARILLILWVILPMILKTCTKYGKYQFWKFPYLTHQNVNFLLALSDRLFSRDLWYKMKLKNSMKPITIDKLVILK